MPWVATPIARPARARRARQRARSSSRLIPGMLSSLSAVPPVWPRARPTSMTMGRPQLARRGPRVSESLSPTPPVECLSQSWGTSAARFQRSPEPSMARVSAWVSSPSRPRMAAAMRKAASWASVHEPSVAPATTSPISSRESGSPARLRSRMRNGRVMASLEAGRESRPAAQPTQASHRAHGGAAGVERRELLLRLLPVGGLRELVDDLLVGLDRLFLALQLVEGQAELVEGDVLGQGGGGVVEHRAELAHQLFGLALPAIEVVEVQAGLGGRRAVFMMVDELAPQLAGLGEPPLARRDLGEVEAGHVGGIGRAVVLAHPGEQLLGAGAPRRLVREGRLLAVLRLGRRRRGGDRGGKDLERVGQLGVRRRGTVLQEGADAEDQGSQDRNGADGVEDHAGMGFGVFDRAFHRRRELVALDVFATQTCTHRQTPRKKALSRDCDRRDRRRSPPRSANPGKQRAGGFRGARSRLPHSARSANGARVAGGPLTPPTAPSPELPCPPRGAARRPPSRHSGTRAGPPDAAGAPSGWRPASGRRPPPAR